MFVRRYDKESFSILLEGSVIRGPVTAHPHIDEAER